MLDQLPKTASHFPCVLKRVSIQRFHHGCSLAERCIGHALGWGIVGVTGTSSGVLGGTWGSLGGGTSSGSPGGTPIGSGPGVSAGSGGRTGAGLGSAGVGSGRGAFGKGAATIAFCFREA